MRKRKSHCRRPPRHWTSPSRQAGSGSRAPARIRARVVSAGSPHTILKAMVEMAGSSSAISAAGGFSGHRNASRVRWRALLEQLDPWPGLTLLDGLPRDSRLRRVYGGTPIIEARSQSHRARKNGSNSFPKNAQAPLSETESALRTLKEVETEAPPPRREPCFSRLSRDILDA